MNKWLSRVWEAPQKALAHIIRWATKAKPFGMINEAALYHWPLKGGLSLSTHIFVPFGKEGAKQERDFIRHEYGHTIQSRKLGPVYLLVIGLPSIIWAGCFKNWRVKHNKSYYDFYVISA